MFSGINFVLTAREQTAPGTLQNRPTPPPPGNSFDPPGNTPKIFGAEGADLIKVNRFSVYFDIFTLKRLFSKGILTFGTHLQLSVMRISLPQPWERSQQAADPPGNVPKQPPREHSKIGRPPREHYAPGTN